MAGGDVEGFAAVAFPIVRRVFAGLIANDLVSVQPMSLPSGLIFFLDFVFSPNLGDRTHSLIVWVTLVDRPFTVLIRLVQRSLVVLTLVAESTTGIFPVRVQGARGYAYASPTELVGVANWSIKANCNHHGDCILWCLTEARKEADRV